MQINFNGTVESDGVTGVQSRIGAFHMSNAVSNCDGLDDKYDDSTAAECTIVRLLQYERLPSKWGTERAKSNGHSGSETTAPIDFPASQQSFIALRLLYDALDYAQQLGRCRWEFAEEIDSLRQHGLGNGDLRWLICNGFVEHGREITELGEEGRKFRADRGLCFSNETCFVLTEHGASHVSRWLNDPADDSKDNPDGLPSPSWDSELQELTVGTTIIKRFKVPARNQETILAAFQEEGWPIFLDDPLPPLSEIDPKRRLHDTINSLNRNQKNRLIRFRGNGSGQGIRWELVRPSESTD